MLRQIEQIPYVKDLVKRLRRNPYLRRVSGYRDKAPCGAHFSQMKKRIGVDGFCVIEAYPKVVGLSACMASVLPIEHVEMWGHFQGGDIDAARSTWNRKILPFVELASIGGARNIRKGALHNMGVIRNPSPARPYSTAGCGDFHRKELSAILELLGKI